MKPDLISGQPTGLVHPCGVPVAAAALAHLLASSELRRDMSARGSREIGRWDADVGAKASASAVAQVVA
jgi:hypothetical protein